MFLFIIMYLKSDLVTGPVIAGVRPDLLFQFRAFPCYNVTGNDLAGGKVVADLFGGENVVRVDKTVPDDQDFTRLLL